MALAVPYDESVSTPDEAPATPSIQAPPEESQPPPEQVSIPSWLPQVEQPQLTDEERTQAVKRSKLRLAQATAEVERQQPSWEKTLLAAALNLREGAVGGTKQAVGNLIRSYGEIVTPETPHAPGSLKSFLQMALGAPLAVANESNPEIGKIVREAGRMGAEEGTNILQRAGEETEALGGGQNVQGIANFARTAGVSAPALLAAPLGLPAAAVAAGLQSYGNNISDFQSRIRELNPNLTEQQAYEKAMLPAAITGAATAVLTRTFGGAERAIENFAMKGLQQGGIKAALKETFKSAALEFPEEYLDQLSQGFVEKAYIDPNKSVKDIFDDAGVAGLSGFLLGGATSAGLHGISHAAGPVSGAISQGIERSRIRRGLGSEGTAITRRVVESQGRQYEGEISPTGSLPTVQRQSIVTSSEGQTETGVAQRGGPGGGGLGAETVQAAPVTTADVVQQAVDQTFPKPPPLPVTPPTKTAVFGGYQYGMPMYKIPGVRPGIMRDVSAATARQNGYTVPETIPSMEEWQKQGSPTGVPQQAAAPAAAPTVAPGNERTTAANTVLDIAEGKFPYQNPSPAQKQIQQWLSYETANEMIKQKIPPGTAAEKEVQRHIAQQIRDGFYDNQLGIGGQAMRSAVAPAQVITAMQERFPGQSVQQIAGQFVNIPQEVIASYPGGITKFEHDLGSMARTPADVAALKAMAEAASAHAKQLMTAGQFEEAMLFAGRQASEAYEYATGNTLEGKKKWDAFEKRAAERGQTYIPPVPSSEYLAEKATVLKSPANPSRLQQLMAQAASPFNWQSYSKVDENGYHILDEEKLKQALAKGEVTGGTASDKLLAYMLSRSDLHPREGIKLLDQTPQEVKKLAEAGIGRSEIQRRAALGGAYHALFTLPEGSRTGAIEMVTRGIDNNPISQAQFVRDLIHELSHNNLDSKLEDAPPEVRQRAEDAYQEFLNKAQGTVWEKHNAATNVNEFIAEALSDPALQKFLSGIDYTGRGGKKAGGMWGEVLDILRRLLKLPEFITTATGQKVEVTTLLDQVFSTAEELEGMRREARGGMAATSPVAPTLSEAQIAAGTSEVGRIADEIYQTREKATGALQGLAYEKQQYQMAQAELRRLTGLATASYGQMKIDPESISYPDPESGVGINADGQIEADNKFVDSLTTGNIAHNPENVKAMQEQVYFEKSARRLINLQERAKVLQSAITYYQQLGVAPTQIEKISKQLNRINGATSKLGAAELEGASVSGRANEIQQAEAIRQERIAQRNALSLQPVADFFGKQVGAYRDFVQKANAGLDLANALKANADPTALKAATDEASKWINIPADIKDAINNGQALSVEQKAVIFSKLGEVFVDFDLAAQRMQEEADNKIPQLNKGIRETLAKLAQTKVESGMGEVMLSDVLSTLGGDSGFTGNLKAMADENALRQRLSAIKVFADTLGKNLETNQALYDWLVDPSKPQPALDQIGNLGVDPETLQMIIREVGRSPAFNSSILTLIDAANSKLAQMPITGLKQIEELLHSGGPANQQAAEQLGQQLKDQAKAQTREANLAMRDNLNQLDQLQIERRSLQEGLAMFSQLAASPEFGAVRDAVTRSPWGLVEPMHAQNNVQTTFKGFGGPGLPSHGELVLGAAQDPFFKREWRKKVYEWEQKAQEYLDAYDAANTLYQSDPANNPSPQQLGFDIPKVRGLREATQVFIPGAFMDVSLNSESKRWKVPWLARKLSKYAWFRQHDMVAKLVGGVTGTDMRTRLADFVNHFLIGQSIRDEYKDIPEKLNAAMRSHDKDGFGMNMEIYREFWNEMAHWGRQFPSPVKAGFVLPRSGHVVTQADINLLNRERAYEEALRRRVTETNVTQGIRVQTPTRVLVRPGAYVGEAGLPRFPGRRADSFIADALAAYNEPLPPTATKGTQPKVRTFDATTPLGLISTNDVVQFWNRNPDLLVQHILDARRNDRAMVQTPNMAQAERDLMHDWLANGVQPIHSLEDLVVALEKKYPGANVTGFTAREQVIKGLENELRQYRDAAQRMATARAESDQARTDRPQIHFSADNEFTRPAAKLELPSALYDYGAVTPGDHVAISNRANYERIVGYATSIQRAIAELQNRLDRYLKGEITAEQAASSYGGKKSSISEMQDVLGILRLINDDFANAYATGSFTKAPRGVINDTVGLLTSAILAMPTVGIRNMVQGQMAVYAMNQAMGTAGQRLTAWNTAKAMPKTLARFALHLGEGTIRRSNSLLAKYLLHGNNYHFFENAVQQLANMIGHSDFKESAAKIKELGFDNREDFIRRLRRIWQETGEFANTEEFENSVKVPFAPNRKLATTLAVLPKAFRALFEKVGVQQHDFAINTAAVPAVSALARRFKDVALNYGKARENFGKFNPLETQWELKPEEWTTGPGAADSLAFMRHQLEQSVSPLGFQLERALWNYYQAQKTNPKVDFFTPEQMDALQRRIIADYNASTPANRPSASGANSFARQLLLLQGYPSDFMLKIINAPFGGVRDRKLVTSSLLKTPATAWLAFMAILIGYVTSAVTGGWEKYVRGRAPSMVTPLDADFWTNFKRWRDATLATGAPQFGYLAELVTSLIGEVRGGRGFDPAGRLVVFSLANRILNALRGSYNTLKGSVAASDPLAVTVRKTSGPLADVGRSTVPYWLEVERALGEAMGPFKQTERLARGEASVQGLLEGRTGFQLQPAGPTTMTRRALGEAVGRMYQAKQAGDAQAMGKAMQEAKEEEASLFRYYNQHFLDSGDDPATAATKAEREVWNAYQDINPVVAAMLGRRPTDAQYELIRKGFTGDRARVFQEGMDAWVFGAQQLFGQPGAITREQLAGLQGGGGGGAPLPGMPKPFRFPTIASGAGRLRRSRTGGAGGGAVSAVARNVLRAATAGASVVRRVGQKVRRPSTRPKTVKFRQPSVPRRRSLVRRPRSPYAFA